MGRLFLLAGTLKMTDIIFSLDEGTMVTHLIVPMGFLLLLLNKWGTGSQTFFKVFFLIQAPHPPPRHQPCRQYPGKTSGAAWEMSTSKFGSHDRIFMAALVGGRRIDAANKKIKDRSETWQKNPTMTTSDEKKNSYLFLLFPFILLSPHYVFQDAQIRLAARCYSDAP